MVILYCLMEFGTARFNEMKRCPKNVTDKTLSVNLKELEEDELKGTENTTRRFRPIWKHLFP